MKTTNIESLYDTVFFEVVTEIAFLPDESSKISTQCIERISYIVSNINNNIEKLESKVNELSEDEKDKWSLSIINLSEKRHLLIAGIKVEIDKQKHKLQSFIDSLPSIDATNQKENLVKQEIMYHEDRITALKLALDRN